MIAGCLVMPKGEVEGYPAGAYKLRDRYLQILGVNIFTFLSQVCVAELTSLGFKLK